MQFIQGYNRLKTSFSTLDDQVEADNPVKLLDAFLYKQAVHYTTSRLNMLAGFTALRHKLFNT